MGPQWGYYKFCPTSSPNTLNGIRGKDNTALAIVLEIIDNGPGG